MKLKKFMVSVLSALFIFSISTSAFAGSVSKTVDEQLIEMGFPEYVIGEMNKLAKETAVTHVDDGSFDSAKIQYFDENMELTNELDFEAGSETIIPRGAIKPTTLSLTLPIINLSNGDKMLILGYEWKILPINRWSDELGLQWDSSRWHAVEDTFYHKSAYNVNTGGHLIEEVTANESSYPMRSSKDGVIWDANLRGNGMDYAVYALYGSGTITIRPYSSGGGTVNGSYMHRKLALGASLGFGSFGLSISGTPGSYDEMSIIKQL